jgi:hypothetical protein
LSLSLRGLRPPPELLQRQEQDGGSQPRQPEEELPVLQAAGATCQLDERQQEHRGERWKWRVPPALEASEVVVVRVGWRPRAEVEPAVQPALRGQREVVVRRVLRERLARGAGEKDCRRHDVDGSGDNQPAFSPIVDSSARRAASANTTEQQSHSFRRDGNTFARAHLWRYVPGP